MNGINKRKFVISYYFKLFSTDFGSIQIFCIIRLANHRKKPGTAILPIQCKTKHSSCHRHSSVRILSGIRAAQSSVFCVVFCRPLFIILSLFVWPLHCLPVFDLWLPITLLASTNFSFLFTYKRTTILSQLSNSFHCNICRKSWIWW